MINKVYVYICFVITDSSEHILDYDSLLFSSLLFNSLNYGIDYICGTIKVPKPNFEAIF